MLIKIMLVIVIISSMQTLLTEEKLTEIEQFVENYSFTVYRKDDGLFYLRNPGKNEILVDMNCNQSVEKKFVYLPLKKQGIFVVLAPMNDPFVYTEICKAIIRNYQEGITSHSNIHSVIQKMIAHTNVLGDLDKVKSILKDDEFAAGEVCIEKGIVKWFTNQSGAFMHSVEGVGFSSFINYIKNNDTDYLDFAYDGPQKIFMKKEHMMDFPNYQFLPKLQKTLTFKDANKTLINLKCDKFPGIYLYLPAKKELNGFPPLFFVKGKQEKDQPIIIKDMVSRNIFIFASDMIKYIYSINPLMSQLYSKEPKDLVIGGICISDGQAKFITNYVEEWDEFMDPNTVEGIAAQLGITNKFNLPSFVPENKKKKLHIWGEITDQELKIVLDLKDRI